MSRDTVRRGEVDGDPGEQVEPDDGRARMRVALQRRISDRARATREAGSDGEVERKAAAGVASEGGALPHREAMERGFGTSFADVRAHTGSQAASASRGIGAEAYTLGNQIAFADGSPSPELVAHEVAHVVQQRAGAGPSGGVGRAGDSFEREADTAAATVAGGGQSELVGRHGAGARGNPVQRQAVQKFDSYEHAEGGDAAAEAPGSQHSDKVDPKSLEKAKAFNAENQADVAEFNKLTEKVCESDGAVDEARVHAWQKEHGLKADGKIGPKSLEKARSLQQQGGGDANEAPGRQSGDELDDKTLQKANAYNAERAAEVAEFNDATARACERDGTVDAAKVHGWQKANGLKADGQIGPLTLQQARSQRHNEHTKLVIKGVEVTRGEINALGDFYKTLDDLMAADPTELRTLVDLIRKQKADPKSVSEADWNHATGGRYMKLNLANSAHFDPSNPAVIPKNTAAPAGNDNRSIFQQYHRQALEEARLASTMKKGPEAQELSQRAQIANSFAEHYLMDAFSAGHLFNKDDLIGVIHQSLKDPKDVDRVMEAVSTNVFAMDSATISNLQDADWPHWDIHNASRFKKVLEGIYKKRPDVVDSTIAKAAHDLLIAHKEGGELGVPVENDHGAKWILSGDRTMADSEKTQMWIQKALEASRANLSLVGQGAADPDALVQNVMGFLPRPTADGAEMMKKVVAEVTDAKGGGMVGAMTEVLHRELKSLLDVLVNDEKKLRVKPGK